MRQAAAGFIRAGRIDRFISFLDMDDLSILIDDERRAIGQPELLNQNSVLLRDRPHVVAEHRITGVEFLFPVRKRGREIRADGQNLRVICIEICDTRLVRV